MDEYDNIKYITDLNGVEKMLEKYGVAVIEDILEEKECDDMLSGMWDIFECLTKDWTTPINRNNKETYKEIYKLHPLHSMLFQHWGVGHAPIVWKIRQNKKVLEVFEKIWRCKKEELLVSFDGLSFGMAPEITKKGWYKSTWYHTDQNFSRNYRDCIQSWITCLDVNQGDATLAFLEGSHLYHESFGKDNIVKKGDWQVLDKNDKKYFTDRGCTPKRVQCKKGSIVLWDSRTIHCGTEAIKGRNKPNQRGIIYLCYQPRGMATMTTTGKKTRARLNKKTKAFNENRMTTHWPASQIKLFPKKPWATPMYQTTPLPPPVLSNIGRRLAGFEE